MSEKANIIEFKRSDDLKIQFIREAFWSNKDYLICESGMYKRVYPDQRYKANKDALPEWKQVHRLALYPISIASPHYEPSESGVFNNIKKGFVEIRYKTAHGLEWRNQMISFEQYQRICTSVLTKDWITSGVEEKVIQTMLNLCYLDGQEGYINALDEKCPPFITVQKVFDKAGYSDDYKKDENGNLIPTKVFLRKGDKKFLVENAVEIHSRAVGEAEKEFSVKSEIMRFSPISRAVNMMSVGGYTKSLVNVEGNYNPYLLIYGEASRGKSKILETTVSHECRPSSTVGNVAQAKDSSIPGLESTILDFNHGFYCIDEIDMFSKSGGDLLALLNGGGSKKRDTKSDDVNAILNRTYENTFIFFANEPFSKIYSDLDSKKPPVISRGIEINIDDPVIHRPLVDKQKYAEWNKIIHANFGHTRLAATEYVINNQKFLQQTFENFIFAVCDHDKKYKELNIEGFEDLENYHFSFLKKIDRTAEVYATMYCGAYIIKHVFGQETFDLCIETLKELLYSRSDERNACDSLNDENIDKFEQLKHFVHDYGDSMCWTGYAWDDVCEDANLYEKERLQKGAAKTITRKAKEKPGAILAYVEITKLMEHETDYVGNIMLTPAGQKKLKDYEIDINGLKTAGEKLNELYLQKYPDRDPDFATDSDLKNKLINELFFVVKAVNGKTEKGKTLLQQLASFEDNFSNAKSKTAFFRLDDYESIFMDKDEKGNNVSKKSSETSDSMSESSLIALRNDPEPIDFLESIDSDDFDYLDKNFSDLV
ncbi:hypothetical protein ACPUEX_22420 [Enterobacter vonholyi]